MHRSALILIPLLFLSSCFSSRKVGSEPKILVVDPVELTLDTIDLSFKPDFQVDTIPEYSGDAVHRIDSMKSKAEALVSIIQDSLLFNTLLTNREIAMDSFEECVIEESSDTLCILGTGDIMPGTNYPDNRYLPPGNNCAALFAPVRNIISSADVSFGNLEGTFCSSGGTAKKCNNPKTCYVFRMPDEYLSCILDAGYDVLSVANNHVNDFGYGGRLSTAALLDEAGVPYAGFRTKPSTTFELDGVKYGFAAFAPHSGTANLKEYTKAAAVVAGLDSICDIVIVSFHGGAEGRDYQNVPCTDEVYLGYNRGNVCKFAHAVVDAGADVVFGHGPHVTRAMELYNNRLICYSLGNFCTYARFNLSGPNGIMPIVKVYTNMEGVFLGGEVIPVYQPGEGGPRLDSSKRVIYKLRELNKTDFPLSKLEIDEDGLMYIGQ